MEIIDQIYEEIVSNLVYGRIYGIPITEENTKVLVVAAFNYGRQKAHNEEQKHIEFFAKLAGK